MRNQLAATVQRVFVEKRSTLLDESVNFTSHELAELYLVLRHQMHRSLQTMPAAAFKPDPNRPDGELGWTAGEIISHNSDRLLWAMDEAAATLAVDLHGLFSASELVKRNAARFPKLLSSTVAIRVLSAATEYTRLAQPVLLAADRGQTLARTHHGEMNLAAWLLLMCIHDNDHLDQLVGRHRRTTNVAGNAQD